MYSRSYTDESDVLAIPDGYGGTSITGGVHNDVEGEDEAPEATGRGSDSTGAGLFSGLIDRLPVGNILGSLTGGSFGIGKIGTEELLIIAAAAFLFFSKDGDRECALLLLLLLFIN